MRAALGVHIYIIEKESSGEEGTSSSSSKLQKLSDFTAKLKAGGGSSDCGHFGRSKKQRKVL